MALTINGVTVQNGDQLYSRRSGGVGRIVEVNGNAGRFAITKGGATRTFTVTQGGMIAGERDLYWHEPLLLDLPPAKVSHISTLQAVVDTLVSRL